MPLINFPGKRHKRRFFQVNTLLNAVKAGIFQVKRS